jgi:hypothetical protein
MYMYIYVYIYTYTYSLDEDFLTDKDDLLSNGWDGYV